MNTVISRVRGLREKRVIRCVGGGVYGAFRGG